MVDWWVRSVGGAPAGDPRTSVSLPHPTLHNHRLSKPDGHAKLLPTYLPKPQKTAFGPKHYLPTPKCCLIRQFLRFGRPPAARTYKPTFQLIACLYYSAGYPGEKKPNAITGCGLPIAEHGLARF